jgi:hypothetical protein
MERSPPDHSTGRLLARIASVEEAARRAVLSRWEFRVDLHSQPGQLRLPGLAETDSRHPRNLARLRCFRRHEHGPVHGK